MPNLSQTKSRPSLLPGLRLLLVLLALLSMVGCLTYSGQGGDGDDDDDAADDDDSADDDDAADDDDDAADDDDDDDDDEPPFEVELITLQGDLTANGSEGRITYSIHYWAEYSASNQTLNCTQQIQADVWFGFGSSNAPQGCINCTGGLGVYSGTVTDSSDPSQEPEHCDSSTLTAAGYNYGMELVDPDGLFGDFSSMSFMDAAVHQQQGIDWNIQNGGLGADDLEAAWAEDGLEYIATGLVRANEGTLTGESGLADLAAPSGPGSNWYGFWQIYSNPANNPHQSAPPSYILSGNYGLSGFWYLGLPPLSE
jgi:hypothetical protein